MFPLLLNEKYYISIPPVLPCKSVTKETPMRRTAAINIKLCSGLFYFHAEKFGSFDCHVCQGFDFFVLIVIRDPTNYTFCTRKLYNRKHVSFISRQLHDAHKGESSNLRLE